MAGTRASRRPQPRVGRPPKDMAGDVRERILNAAEKVFLERGFQSASIDEIAALAPASKPTIYAHFPGKEALFAAVVGRIVDGLMNYDDYVPKGRTVREKLMSFAGEIVERAIADSVAVTRATIAEADRLPELSRSVHDAAKTRSSNVVARLLDEATHMTSRASKGPFSAKRKLDTAQIFMDLILLPMLMRALMGEEAKELRKEAPGFVQERVGFFLAACDRDWT